MMQDPRNARRRAKLDTLDAALKRMFKEAEAATPEHLYGVLDDLGAESENRPRAA